MQTSHTLPSLAHQDVCMFPGSMYLVRGWGWGMGMSTTLCLKRPPQISAGVLLLPQPQMCYLSLICYAGEMPIHWTGHLKTSWADSRIDWTRHGGFTSIMSMLRRLRQKYHGFKASLNYIARPCQKQKCWGKPPMFYINSFRCPLSHWFTEVLSGAINSSSPRGVRDKARLSLRSISALTVYIKEIN